MLEQLICKVCREPDLIPGEDLEFEEGRPMIGILRVVRRPGDEPRLLQEVLDVRPFDGAGDGLEKAVRQGAKGLSVDAGEGGNRCMLRPCDSHFGLKLDLLGRANRSIEFWDWNVPSESHLFLHA